jgi:UPF0271 protein
VGEEVIDINCDMGESYGQFKVGDDEAIFPYISSCSIACGFHGGDPVVMERTVKLALEHGVRIGAHPSYPDLTGFGRRYMQIERDEIKSIVKYQICALKGITESLGGKVEYVKPHGALYNAIAGNGEYANGVYEAIKEIDPSMAIMGLAGSVAYTEATKLGMTYIHEAFADRVYESDGTLMSRAYDEAVISDPARATAQVLTIIQKKHVISNKNTIRQLHADSICIHGDNPGALDILRALEGTLKNNQIVLRNRMS